MSAVGPQDGGAAGDTPQISLLVLYSNAKCCSLASSGLQLDSYSICANQCTSVCVTTWHMLYSNGKSRYTLP